MADEELPSYTPQSLNDILPIYHADSHSNSLEAFTLRQTSPSSQSLLSQDSDSESPSYNVKIFATGGFMNKKPHMILTKRSSTLGQPAGVASTPTQIDTGRRLSLFRHSPSPPSSTTSKISPPSTLSEARFDIHGTGTSISYLPPPSSTLPQSQAPPSTQRLELYNSGLQILRTRIGNVIHYWQPHPGNDAVLELVDEAEEIIARFTYQPSTVRSTHQNAAGVSSVQLKEKKKDHFKAFDIGTLELVGIRIPSIRAREEVLCSAVVVVERARRRAVNLGLATGKGGAKIGAGVPCGNMLILTGM